MSVTIAINDDIAGRLKLEADALRTSVEAVANDGLSKGHECLRST